MGALIYSACALVALVCSVLLLRGWRAARAPLLLWSGLCFVGLTVSNVLLVLDRIVYPQVDLSTLRLTAAFVGLLLMLYGLIWESD